MLTMAAPGRRRRRRRGLRSACTELSPNSREGCLRMHIKKEKKKEVGSDEREESKDLRGRKKEKYIKWVREREREKARVRKRRQRDSCRD